MEVKQKIYARQAPYSQTTVTVKQSMQQINQLLKRYGLPYCEWKRDNANNTMLLQFPISNQFYVSMRPPRIYKSVKHNGTSRDVINHPQCMRHLYWQIKAILESEKFGLTRIRAFMSHIALPNRPDTTLGDVLEPQLAHLDQLQLDGS